MNKNVIIIGLGGVGGYFGFKIAQNNHVHQDYRIAFVARGQTFEVISEKGLKLLSSEHSNPVTKPDYVVRDIEEIAQSDLILICVKEYSVENGFELDFFFIS